ncbi:MAG: acyltransferase [Burkholderiales bacterium]|nr:acyltransferase [Burkholderiales bacterium]
MLRSRLNRLRRALVRALGFRIVFGEAAADGRPLPRTRISPSTCIENGQGLVLADNVFIGHFNFIEASHGVRIEAGVQITNYVSIVSHSSHRSLRLMGEAYTEAADARPGFVAGEVRIGAYSYIGPHCLIEAGTRIGKGCLVQAFSRVRGEFADFAVIGGNPAVVVGDTRDADARLLAEHPQWRARYEAWAGVAPAEAPDA